MSNVIDFSVLQRRIAGLKTKELNLRWQCSVMWYQTRIFRVQTMRLEIEFRAMGALELPYSVVPEYSLENLRKQPFGFARHQYKWDWFPHQAYHFCNCR